MRGCHSDALLLVHVVWSTHARRSDLHSTHDGWLHDVITTATAAVDARVIAVGNADDHVHVIACHPAARAVAELVHRIKGVSSHAWNQRSPDRRLRWQRGYWARSVDRASLVALVPYVVHQRQHHRSMHTRADWEQNAPTVAELAEARPPGGLTHRSVPPASALSIGLFLNFVGNLCHRPLV
jgi:REP element-mobilizing transposase RayT